MKILMVCLGNICRSPIAEGVMRKLVKQQGLNWEIASAGTGAWHIGSPPDFRSVKIAKRYGYDISAQRARLFTAKLFTEFDHILVMDHQNYKDVIKLATNEKQKNKVSYFLVDNSDLVDPYYNNDLFDSVFKLVEARCETLVMQLK